VYKHSNLCSSVFRAYTENEPSAKPIAVLSQTVYMFEESRAMDIGKRSVSVSGRDSGVVANNFLSCFRLQVRRPAIESAATTVVLDIITSRGGSGDLSATTISLTAHLPCDLKGAMSVD
jgi:hypothetical protein